MKVINKYTIIDKKYLAESMSFLGFNYKKLLNDKGATIYGFENTELFNEALYKLLELRKLINKKK